MSGHLVFIHTSESGITTNITFCIKWYYSKNPYPLRTCIILTRRSFGSRNHIRQHPSDSWCSDSWEVGNYTISQWVWVLAFIPWPMGMTSLGVDKSLNYPHPFSPYFHAVHGITWMTFQDIASTRNNSFTPVILRCCILTLIKVLLASIPISVISLTGLISVS